MPDNIAPVTSDIPVYHGDFFSDESILDPHSVYLTEEAFEGLQEATSGEFTGLGIEVGMEDGYVKIPAVATRKDFNPKDYSPEALEKIKLEDGIHHHEFVKVELHTYAVSTGEEPVKPFMLVVAQDTRHASQLKHTIESLFDNRYAGKVLEIHSKLKGDESDENMQRLLEVEHDNDTEIVIHVNKLKEGWDCPFACQPWAKRWMERAPSIGA